MEPEYMQLFIELLLVLFLVLLIAEKKKQKISKIENPNFYKLQTKYLFVFGLATFADWLQGAYLYKIYSSYQVKDSDIAIIYIFGFISSGVFGWVIGNIADRFGRKKICVVYNIFYIISCYLHSINKFEILVLARVFGGLCSCILFSSFESWYVYEHCSKHNFPKIYLNDTFAKSTFINGITAVIAGLTGNFLVDTLHLKYISVFYLAIIVLIVNSILTIVWWDETIPQLSYDSKNHSIFNAQALKFILIGRNRSRLILVGVIQLLFETCMYNFIFLWTPVLSSVDHNTPLGLVFALFMISIMIGSSIYSIISLKPTNIIIVLVIACLISFHAFILCTLIESKILLFFICYELAVGMYFPCMSYIRSELIPEQIRNSVTNWFRLPINLFTIVHLLLIRNEHLQYSTIFSFLSLFMLLAFILSLKLQKFGLFRAVLPAPVHS